MNVRQTHAYVIGESTYVLYPRLYFLEYLPQIMLFNEVRSKLFDKKLIMRIFQIM